MLVKELMNDTIKTSLEEKRDKINNKKNNEKKQKEKKKNVMPFFVSEQMCV